MEDTSKEEENSKEESSKRNLTSMTAATSHPCYCLQLVLKALLGCLGLEDNKGSSGEIEKTTEDIPSSVDVRGLPTSLLARSRRPKKPPVDPGSPGQHHSSNT